ncbi:unnamed protein product [Symbiodinium natans]|uniref:Uncharacterized protein n=1 Tax=Symbiodinium natans TaxID=878477 RepID=A0A812H8H9_9DINO|nr:unnamed protein product [Symbiodinium natans]
MYWVSVWQLAMSLQLLAKQATGSKRLPILRDRRLPPMLTALGDHAQDTEVWVLPAALCGVARLGAFGTGSALSSSAAAAADILVRAADDRFTDLSAAQSSLVLASLALSAEISASKVGSALRQKLVSTLELRCQELPPQSAAALVPALVKLRTSGGTQLAPGVAQRIVESPGLAVNDIATAAAGLAALRATPPRLLEMADKAVQEQVHLCTPRAVVQLSASLSEGGADHDTFKDYLMPAARSFLLDFGPRDLCTLAESFAKATAAETDFIVDLADTLKSKVTDMGPHEVSVAFLIFAPVSYAVPELVPAVSQQLKGLVGELSPKQLAHVLRGLNACNIADAPLFEVLRRRASQLSHVFFGTHAVSALVAFAEAEQIDVPTVRTLGETILRHIDRLPAQDYIVVLTVVSRLSADTRLVSLPPSFVEELLQALRQRGYGDWRLDPEAVVHLLEALRDLRVEDEILLELVCDRLPVALAKSKTSLLLMVRLLECLGELPSRSRAQVATHLHRRRKLQSALKDCFTEHAGKRLDLEARVVMARAIAGVGLENQYIQTWLDLLVASDEAQMARLSAESCADLSWSLAQMSWQIEWNRRFSRDLLRRLHPADAAAASEGEESLLPFRSRPAPGALLRLAWACAVLGEAPPLPLLSELYSSLNGQFPQDWCGTGLRQLQEVALHWQLHSKALGPGESSQLATEVQEWLALALEVPRPDQYLRQQPRRAERRRKQISAAKYSYETWLTVTLAQLHVPHQAQAVIGCHRVPITFRAQRHLIDVLDLQDITAPANRITGAAELRRRQLLQLGWAMHSIHLRELHEAVRTGKLRLTISKLIASLDPGAARAASFSESAFTSRAPKVQVLNRGRWQSSNIHQALGDFSEDSGEEDEEDRGSARLRNPRSILQERALKAAQQID